MKNVKCLKRTDSHALCSNPLKALVVATLVGLSLGLNSAFADENRNMSLRGVDSVIDVVISSDTDPSGKISPSPMLGEGRVRYGQDSANLTSHEFQAFANAQAEILSSPKISRGQATGFAAGIQPVVWDGSPLKFVEGTSSNYNFTTKDSDGIKYWLIQLDSNKMYAQNGIWSTEPISGYTSSFTITLPNSKTATLYYKYTQPSNYSSTSTRITSLTSTNAKNKVFSTPSVSGTSGGAIYNTSSTTYDIISDFISNKQTSTSQYQGGGAIYNSGKINSIKGYFYNNGSITGGWSLAAQGGAIFNKNGTIQSVEGVFINNYSLDKDYNCSAQAGAIFNKGGTINNINGVFIGNKAESYNMTSGLGSAIREEESATFGTITGVFINNYSYSYGRYAVGAISIDNSSKVDKIYGDFINNGAVSNASGSLIGRGGAIDNATSTINEIKGNFINNYLSGKAELHGGAIDNAYSNALLKNLEGLFVNNSATTSALNAYGGALYNEQRITNLSNSEFIGNHTSATTGSSRGGAIYNTGTISNITNSTFLYNYAYKTSGTAQGGAIYTNQNLTFNSTDGYNSTYSGNYIQTGTNGAKLNEAIYVASSSAKLTFNARTNGQFTFDDYINGLSGYDAQFTGDSTGKVNLYNDIKNGDVITDTVTMNLENGNAHDYNFRTLNSNANTKWNIDVDVSDINNPAADRIVTSASGSTGSVTLTDVNFANSSIEDIINKQLKVQVLKTQNSNIQLKLGSDLTNGLLHKGEKVLKTDELKENSKWTDVYTSYNVATDVYGTAALATTSTTNDSVSLKVTGIQENISDVTELDTLSTVNRSDLSSRKFNATVEGETYTVKDDLGKAGVGTITINGQIQNQVQEDALGTVNLNGHKGFELDKATTLNINGTNLKDNTNSAATLISVSNSNAKVNLSNSKINGNIIATSVFNITTSGNTTLNGNTTNVNLSNSGTLDNKGTITGTVVNNSGLFKNNGTIAGNVTVSGGEFQNNSMITGNVTNAGILTSSTTNLGGTINNSNVLNLSGVLNKAISGNGTTYVNDMLTVNSGSLIQGKLNVNGGTLKVSPNAITNLSVGTLEGLGYLELDIDYSGSQVSMDSLTTANNGTGYFVISKLNETGARKDFSIQVLNGVESDLKLIVDNAIANAYKRVDVDTEYEYDPIISPAKWTDVFNTKTTVTTTTRELFVENDKKLTYGITNTDIDVSHAKTGDTLDLVSRSSIAEREFNATEEGQTYYTDTNLGASAVGIMTINGNPNASGDEGATRGTIDLDSHTGFDLDKATTLNLNDVEISNATGDVVKSTSTDAKVNLANSKIDGNVSNSAGEITLENSEITGVTANDGTLNLNEGAKLGTLLSGSGTTNINADYTLNHTITGNDVVLNGAELSVASTGSLSGANTFTVESGSTLNLQNGLAANTDLGNFVLNGDMALKIDGNFASKQIDTITATSFSNPNDSSISITNVNVLTPVTDEQFSISPIGEMEDAGVKAALASAIEYNAGDIAMTPIYKYSVVYDKDNAMLQFTRSGGGGGGDFNPAVEATPVATQAAAQVTMEQTFNYSFSNSDTFMTLPNLQRIAIRNRNRYALSESELPEGANPLYKIQDTSSAWFKPYASFENVPLKNGPKVNVISYGALAGYDTDLKELRKGWARAWTGFVGYNGAHISYNDVTTVQNGGLLGGTLTMYKGNFFNATTLSVGATVGENNTMYGHETTTSLLSGIGNKTGYNFEFKEGKFIVQPSLFLGYTMVKTFDYTNAAGVRINSDPSHTFQISPGLKFIGNLKHGWQPYIGVNMVWNVLNNSHVKANSVTLPQMSVKPYIQYGIGLQKTVKDNFVAYGQAMIQNAGRNGISLTAGFRWAIGKNHKKIEKVQKPSNEQKVSNKKILKRLKNDKPVKQVSKNINEPNKSSSQRKVIKQLAKK